MKKELLDELLELIKKESVCESKGTTEIQINRKKEPLFKKLLVKIINEEKQHEERDLVNSLAHLLQNSPITSDRYLTVQCSSVGIFEKKRIGFETFVQYKAELT